uniref:WGS project CBMG000000000 data, contig CS5907-c003457 n=1 Tax=Fusarium acuminatum CS5907 TaxID=1318461 RepID=A0A090N556_9HYPO|nr:unnamed protein product [Fusarium acuminatum CS5907]
MDYASNVCSYRRGVRETKWLNKAQKVGAQAITGAFKTVSVAVAEAEAGITPVGERHSQAGTRLYINMQTLPKTHPLKVPINYTTPNSLVYLGAFIDRNLAPAYDT